MGGGGPEAGVGCCEGWLDEAALGPCMHAYSMSVALPGHHRQQHVHVLLNANCPKLQNCCLAPAINGKYCFDATLSRDPTCWAAAMAACMAEPNMALVMRPARASLPAGLGSNTCANPLAPEALGAAGAAGVLNSTG